MTERLPTFFLKSVIILQPSQATMQPGNERMRKIDSIDSPPIRFKVTSGKIFYMIAGNTLIAFFISIVHPDAAFPISFLFSQSIGLTTAACVIFAVNYFKALNLKFQAVTIVTAIVAGVLIGTTVGRLVVVSMLPDSSVHLLEKYNFRTSTLGYAVLFGFIVSYIFISLQKLSDEKIKRLEVEKNAAVTEMKLLQSQMEPHFLFNTLSNILGLIDSDPQKASRMLESFTSFLRSSLITARSETITLAQEMDVIRNYLDIFAVRMGDRLRYRIDLPDHLRDVRIPPLLIQPLVENAVKHGLEPSVQGGELQVRAEGDENGVRIVVTDTGIGVGEMSAGNGIGLDNIKKRLSLLYGEQGRLLFEENRPTGVRAVIDIPYDPNSSDHSRR